MVKVSKAFLNAGWTPAAGDTLKSLGSALVAFLFTGGDATLGTWRIAVGARKCRLERRAHGTPTGRCSRGHWVRIDDAPTPKRASDWTRLGKFWAGMIREYDGTPGEWGWAPDNRQGSVNGCGSVPAECQRKSKKMTAKPTRHGTFGYAPATGRNLAARDEKAIKAAKRARRRARRNAREAERREAARYAGRCRGWRREGR